MKNEISQLDRVDSNESFSELLKLKDQMENVLEENKSLIVEMAKHVESDDNADASINELGDIGKRVEEIIDRAMNGTTYPETSEVEALKKRWENVSKKIEIQ